MTTLDELFADMDDQVGISEVPTHSNHVRLRDGTDLWPAFYGSQPPTAQAAWCALFQSAMETRNGTPLPAIDFHGGFVGVDAGRAYFDAHGLIEHVPVEGYLAFYKEHVGRVRKVHDAAHWTSLEGNEGDGVRLVERTMADIVGGFGVRHYQGPPAPPTEEDDVQRIYTTDPNHDPGQIMSDGGVLAIIPDGQDAADLVSQGFQQTHVEPPLFDVIKSQAAHT